MQSMTGFGKSRFADASRAIEVEVRSVNHRFLKTQVRASRALSSHEHELEALVRDSVGRGAISLSVRLREESTEPACQINAAEVRQLWSRITKLAKELGAHEPTAVEALLALPGIVTVEERNDVASEACLAQVDQAVRTALDELVEMRRREGARLEAELHDVASRIKSALGRIEALAPQTVAAYRDKVRKRITQLLGEVSDRVAVNDEDILRESAIFADRADISEEIQRLGSHLIQFGQLLPEEKVGRKLDFVVQEMLREANTIASKASDYEIAELVIEVKSDIERLREQVQNVE